MNYNKDRIIAKFLSGNASDKETKMLQVWLNENPLNQLEFDKAKKIWEASLFLKKEKKLDTELAWADFNVLAENQKQVNTAGSNYRGLKMAAAVSLFVVFSVVVKIYFSENNTVTPALLSNISTASQPESVSVITEMLEVDTTLLINESTKKKSARKAYQREWKKNPGMITLITGDSAKAFVLPDHSIVLLNANSKLEYLANYTMSNRRVSLLGEAFFEVKKDSAQFVVSCENTIVRGNDASFNLKSYAKDKEVEVIVVAGEVEFSGIGRKEFKKLNLTKGQTGLYKKDQDIFEKKDSHRKNYKWWKKSLRASLKSLLDKLFGKNKDQKNSNQVK
jgi:ferric-dicitrate binding protein FerR (iron transport regulator)